MDSIEQRPQLKSFKKLNYERIFFLIWTFYGFTYILFNASEFSYMYELTIARRRLNDLVIILLILLCIAFRHYKKKEIIKIACFLGLIFLIELFITDRTFLIMILFMIAASKIDVRKLIRFDIKLKLFILFLILFLCWTGIIVNYETVINGNYKQAFGFSHPNTFSCFAYSILLEWMYIRFRDLKFTDWILQAVFSILVLMYGGGRSVGYSYFGILILFYIAKINSKLFYSRLSYFMFTIITPLMAALSFAGAYFYSQGNVSMIALNQVFTSRLSSAARFLEQYGIKLFGQEIETISSRMARIEGVKALILDCAYVRCGIMYGFLFLILFCAVYSIMFRKLLRTGQISLALFALYFVIIGIGETYLLNVLYNVTLLCFLEMNNPEKEMQLYQKYRHKIYGAV